MTAAKLKVGSSVQTTVDPRQNNGEEVAAALVTKVNDDGTVNLRVFFDSDEVRRVTNVTQVSTENKAKKESEKDDDENLTPSVNPARVCW